MHSYEKAANSKLCEYKTITTKLGKAHSINVPGEMSNIKFSIMKEGDNETYLGDVI